MLASLSDSSRARRSFWIALVALACVRCAQLAGLTDYEPPAAEGGGPGTLNASAGQGGSISGGAGAGGKAHGMPGGGAGVSGGASYPRPPSCAQSLPGAGHDCGASKTEDCCASSLVDAGSYQCLAPPNEPTPVEPFRLDHFEVTVGRFQVFASAVNDGWRPRPGEGQHPAAANFSEDDLGWKPAWNVHLPSGRPEENVWDPHVGTCDFSTWILSAPERAWLPINCVTYFHAMAYCIWDGGYLPSALELSYAAQGGEQRMYPWGNEPIDPQRAAYVEWSGDSPQPVGSLPLGDGRWGHSDQVGNLWEWTSYNSENGRDCVDCSCDSFEAAWMFGRTFGGSYDAARDEAFATSYQRVELERGDYLRDRGIRCARAP